MEDFEKLNELRTVLDPVDDDDATLLTYLSIAKDVILHRMYPYMDDEEYIDMNVPKRHEYKQIRIAAYLLNKRGAEGELQHIENGIHRNYKNADVPEDLLWDVYPSIGIPR